MCFAKENHAKKWFSASQETPLQRFSPVEKIESAVQSGPWTCASLWIPENAIGLEAAEELVPKRTDLFPKPCGENPSGRMARVTWRNNSLVTSCEAKGSGPIGWVTRSVDAQSGSKTDVLFYILLRILLLLFMSLGFCSKLFAPPVLLKRFWIALDMVLARMSPIPACNIRCRISLETPIADALRKPIENHTVHDPSTQSCSPGSVSPSHRARWRSTGAF